MAEDQQVPDWLADLAGERLGQELEDEPRLEEESEEPEEPKKPQEEEVTRSLEDIFQQESQPDVVGDLREQMVESEGDFGFEEVSPGGILPGMKPSQGFVLALLLLLNVLVLGCMALLVTGRVVFPF